MFRYNIYLFVTKGNEVSCLNYNARHIEFNGNSINLYPIDYCDVMHIHLDSNMRVEIIPYMHLLEINRKNNEN